MNGKLRHIERRKAAQEKAYRQDVEFQEWMNLMDEAKELAESLHSKGVAIPQEIRNGVLTWDTCEQVRNGLNVLRELEKGSK